ncbi:MAG: CobW family GTP-binding protein [Candidatus Borkfalkiaceae bacterium]|nr:CobW family GTP-binding protein [Christensenellaceae bacterium]
MVKVDVISGFLGAGKTTLIKSLFKSRLKNEKTVLIENEFGEIGVDGAFLKDSGVEIKEINSGCICCSLVGDFSKSMCEIVDKFNPDRIIIEPSGVGKLSDIIKAVEKVEEDLKINIVATVVDGGKCKMYHKNFGEFFNDQISQAKVVIVSKTENLDENKIEGATEIIRELNPDATIITTPVSMLDPNKVLDTLEAEKSGYDEFLASLLNEEHGHCHHHHDDDDDEDEHDHCCHHHHDDDDDGEEEHDHCHHHDDDDEDDHDHCCHHHHDDDDDDEEEHDHCHHHHEHGHHHADEVFTSWGKETAKAFGKSELEGILKVLADENSGLGVILRAKGVVRASDNEKWYYFDLVAGEYEIRLGDPDITGKVCVIGSKIDENKIESLFFKV